MFERDGQAPSNLGLSNVSPDSAVATEGSAQPGFAAGKLAVM
jgi:hypothetical protein